MSKKTHTQVPSKKHHYVPRFLLRGFSENGTHLNVYDKRTDASFPSTIADAGSENYFNTLPEDLIKKGVDKTAMETILAEFDGHFSSALKKLLDGLKIATILSRDGFPKYYLDEELLYILAEFVTTQTVRTKEFREAIAQSHLLMTRHFAEMTMKNAEFQKEVGPPPVENLKINIKLNEGVEKLLHFENIFDPELQKRLFYHCISKIWLIGVNQTEMPFYCSDHPVVMRTSNGRPAAWGALGVEIAMPISTKYILIWKCPSLFPKDNFGISKAHVFDRRTISLSAEHVKYYNSLLYLQSTQYLYGPTEDFTFLKELSAVNESYHKNPFRQRFEIHGMGEKGILTSDYRKNGLPVECHW